MVTATCGSIDEYFSELCADAIAEADTAVATWLVCGFMDEDYKPERQDSQGPLRSSQAPATS